MSTFRAPDIGRREVRSPLRPASTARRMARRAGWAVAAGVAVASPKIAEWIGGLISPPTAVEAQRSRSIGSVLPPQSPSPEFLKHWQRELPRILKTYLGIKTDADMAEKLSSFVYKPTGGDGEMYIWRPQDMDTVSEATGYGAKIISNYSAATGSREYQPIFNGLIKGYLTARQSNPNGLMPWRLEREITERGPNGEVTKARLFPPSLTDKHSATDAELYTVWALIEADQLVKNTVWEAPAEGRDFYRILAADILSKIKAHCVVEMNGRLVLTVSDAWGHPDILTGAVTINPSYFNPTALRIFAEFDRSQTSQGENYWLKVLKDNFDVFSESINFSRQMFSELRDPEKRKQHLIENTQGNYVMDWVRREYLRSLLGRAGFELTEFGIEPLENNGVRLTEEEKSRRQASHLLNGDPSLVQMDKGQLVVTKEMFEKILNQINDAHVVPFVPDQLEVSVEPDGKIAVRIEFGESQLSFVEKYDGIRGYRELAVYLVRYDDTSDPSVPVELKVSSDMQKLLLDLMRGKQAANARVDQFREITPLATLLIGAYGTGGETRAVDFEAEFNRYINKYTFFDPADKGKRIPRYFGPTLALLSLTEALEMGAQTSSEILPLKQGVAPAHRVEEEREKPLPPSTNLLDAPLDFLVDYMTNFGSKPTYPITAQKMARDAQANAEQFRPTRATAHYNAGSGLRNAGKYRAAADEFYQSLLLARWKENPREVLMAMFNIEQILKTLNYAPAEIAQKFMELSEREDLDRQVRLALTGGAVKQLNDAGNYNRALLLGIDFLKRYKELKEIPSLIDQLKNYSENTDLPCRQLLLNAITQIMRATAQQGRIADFTYQENGKDLKVQMLEFESQVTEDIVAILLGGQDRRAAGQLGELLRLVQELRGEVPEVFKPRIRLAEAQVQMDIMFNLYTQIKRLSLLTPGRDSLGKIDSRLGIFTPLRIKILQAGARAEQVLREVLRTELRGERNTLVLDQALRGISAIRSFIPKIRTDLTGQQSLRYLYEPTEGQRRSPRSVLGGQLAGLRPDETVSRKDSFKRERWETNNLDYKKSLFVNQVAQDVFRNLGLKDYIGDLPLDTENPSLYLSFILGALALLLRAGKIKKLPKIRKKLAAGSGFAAVLALALGFQGDAAGKKVGTVQRTFSPDEVTAFLEADELLAHPESALSPLAYQIFSGIRRDQAELPLEMQIEMTLEELNNHLSTKARDLLGTRFPGWNLTIGPATLQKILDKVGLSDEEKVLFENLTEEDRVILRDMQQITRLRQAGFLDLAGLIHESASLLAQANPSADPRNVLLITLMLDSASLYGGWSETAGDRLAPEDLSPEAYQLYEKVKEENPDLGLAERLNLVLAEPGITEANLEIINSILRGIEDPFANERLDRLELALKACEGSTRIYISNSEHRMDLTIQAVTQMAQLTHNYLDIIREMVTIDSQKPIFSGGLPENMDPNLRKRFVDQADLLRARFSAMLGEREDFPAELNRYLVDPVVKYLFDENTRPNLFEIFRKYPLRRANAYAFLGSTTWWGKKEVHLFIKAMGYYDQALQYDYFNIQALFGKLQLITMDEMQKAYQTIEESLKREKDPEVLLQNIKDLVNTLGTGNASLAIINHILEGSSLSIEDKISQSTAYLAELLRDVLVVDRDTVFRTYRRALQAAQRGGVNENIVASLINLSGNLWTNDPLSRDLAKIAGGTASNDIKVILLLDRMRLEGF